VEQAEDTVSGTENRVEELDQRVQDHEKMLRKYEWNMQDIWDTHEKIKPRNCGYGRRRGERN
jgi:DNA repair ATPase RecN